MYKGGNVHPIPSEESSNIGLSGARVLPYMNTGVVTERKREMLQHFRNSVEVIEYATDCLYLINAALEGPVCGLLPEGLSRLERDKQGSSEGGFFEHSDSKPITEPDCLG